MNFEPNESVKASLEDKRKLADKPIVTYVKTADIEPNPNNQIVYEDFKDKDDFKLLYESVKTEGILQPLYVIPHPEQYTKFIVIAGHRRLEAAKQCHLEYVPVIIGNVEDLDNTDLQISLITTNMMVRNKTPGEKAKEIDLLESLLKEKRKKNPAAFRGIKIREMLSKITGISERTISDYQQVNHNLSAEKKEQFHEGEISLAGAKEIVQKPKQNKKQEEKIFSEKDLEEYFQILEELMTEDKYEQITKYIKNIIMN